MKNMFGEKGYAFPEIISAPIIDDETRIVDVEFRVTPGNRSKVRRITFLEMIVLMMRYIEEKLGKWSLLFTNSQQLIAQR